MRIAVLGWGSLIRDPGEMPLAGPFEPNGPHLPLEFSRISNNGRLTLVIDESSGTSCATYVAPSAARDLDEAIDGLKHREGMRRRSDVGFIDMRKGMHSAKARERHPRSLAAIEGWAKSHDCAAVIWTALPSNFRERTDGIPFSPDAAIRYLETLREETLELALQYFRNAPPEILCFLRTAVDQRWPRD
jgi:hypothetical protein